MRRLTSAPRPPLRALLVFLFAFTLLALPGRASVGILVGEPYGAFGTMLPVGHSALYFDHLCTASPNTLRPCAPGEPGAVVARYHRIADLDWLVTPVIPFLYGVDEAADIPAFVTPQLEASLREDFRRRHLAAVVPDRMSGSGEELPAGGGEWTETIGSAFHRRLFLYEIDTTAEQDAALVEWLQSRPDQRRYSLRHANCADFVADAINLLYPGTMRRNGVGDFGMMTPKQTARLLEAFGLLHPELHLRVYEIPQLPGTLRRSRPVRGAAETFVKTKRYLAFFLAVQPELALADWLVYEKKDKWTPRAPAAELSATQWLPGAGAGAAQPVGEVATRALSQPSRSTSSSTASDSIGLRAK